jgi:protein tyrosine/serine phosphatase
VVTSSDYAPLHLDWPGMYNVRDLGGLPLREGAVRRGALIRSESLTRLGEGGVEALREAGVSRVVDLRRPGESPEIHPYADDGDVYVNLPVEDPADIKETTGPMVDLYVDMVEARPELFAAAVGAVADAPEGAVVVHCAGGKDRTGLVVAMALTLVGADPEVVAADYALTEVRNGPLVEPYLQEIEDLAARERLREYIATPASNILTVLAHLDEHHGSVEAYLLSGGMTEEQVRRLRERLVSPGGPDPVHEG